MPRECLLRPGRQLRGLASARLTSLPCHDTRRFPAVSSQTSGLMCLHSGNEHAWTAVSKLLVTARLQILPHPRVPMRREALSLVWSSLEGAFGHVARQLQTQSSQAAAGSFRSLLCGAHLPRAILVVILQPASDCRVDSGA
jgi:hypothetical protein